MANSQRRAGPRTSLPRTRQPQLSTQRRPILNLQNVRHQNMDPPSRPYHEVVPSSTAANDQLPVLHSRQPSADTFEVKVNLGKLPKHWGTLQIYRRFSCHGNLVRIEIFEPRGDKTVGGYMVFRPPPRDAFWLHRTVTVKGIDGHQIPIDCFPDEPNKALLHLSPADLTHSYPELAAVTMKRVDFGMMRGKEDMLVLYSAESTASSPLRPSLYLQHKTLQLTFAVTINDSVSSFKIVISLAQIESVTVIGNRESNEMLLQLKMPPLIFRRTKFVEDTHYGASTRWTEKQAWLRQTSVEFEGCGAVSDSVTQLFRDTSLIDIGRWLTYRLVFSDAVTASKALYLAQQALMDHNINASSIARLQTTYTSPAALWSSLLTPDDLDSMTAPCNQLTFPVRYQLEVCISQRYLLESTIDIGFIQRLASMEVSRATRLLEKIADLKVCYYNPTDIFKVQFRVNIREPKMPRYCTRIPSAVVTPTTIYFGTPVMETSNRVVRQFCQHEDRFLRVKFTDERYKGKLWSDDDDVSRELFVRIKRTMCSGIRIGDRKYEFLAFGNSQFREHGAYFFASTSTLTANMIRKWMGDFTPIRAVAKHASRIGQCFSTTRTVSIKVETNSIPDIHRNGFCFSDGVGKISPFLARMIAEEFGLPNSEFDFPSVFQFRLGGCKGVLAVDPNTKGRVVCVRPSQNKFQSGCYGFEINRVSRFSAAHLNVQIILVLSALGVPDEAFVTRMDEVLSNVNKAMIDRTVAEQQLQKNIDYNQMTLMLTAVVHDFMDVKEPFVISCLHLWRSWVLKYLKEKARIPVEQGAFVLGCVDETATLHGHSSVTRDELDHHSRNDPASLPEIFLQISDSSSKGHYRIVQGICILARNPSLHPGDIRVVRAVDVPELRHLKNCVVLPQNGDRDLANMCSGGDLDGDDYLVMWDTDLIPKEWNHPPMEYRSPSPIVSENEVTVDDMINFFIEHIQKDNLGRIATAHRYWADALVDGVKDERCLELARLHSKAVDFPKTGVPAEFPKELRIQRWPHWAEVKNKPPGKIYHSTRIVGLLYDRVQRVEFQPALNFSFDQRLLQAASLNDDLLRAAREVKEQYDEAVRRIMAHYGIKSEFEVFTTFALEHNSDIGDYKFAETIGEVVAAMKQQHQDLCYEKAGTTRQEKKRALLDPFVVAMYKVTADEFALALAEHNSNEDIEDGEQTRSIKGQSSMPFTSFPWIFYHDLARIAIKGIVAHGQERVNTPASTEKTDRSAKVEPNHLEPNGSVSQLSRMPEVVPHDDFADEVQLFDACQSEVSPTSPAQDDKLGTTANRFEVQQSEKLRVESGQLTSPADNDRSLVGLTTCSGPRDAMIGAFAKGVVPGQTGCAMEMTDCATTGAAAETSEHADLTEVFEDEEGQETVVHLEMNASVASALDKLEELYGV